MKNRDLPPSESEDDEEDEESGSEGTDSDDSDGEGGVSICLNLLIRSDTSNHDVSFVLSRNQKVLKV